eukprot:TRINITY_DN19162_c1_g2_i1.p5 TRINITY_DN19162_c1_g2~~TRINITY_DN19162_c1_g2_i1.p5  ORF type:complete len:103 (+),score=2.84 TRINITY_DN19162_c1_g2_i1:362-670(+)
MGCLFVYTQEWLIDKYIRQFQHIIYDIIGGADDVTDVAKTKLLPKQYLQFRAFFLGIYRVAFDFIKLRFMMLAKCLNYSFLFLKSSFITVQKIIYEQMTFSR